MPSQLLLLTLLAPCLPFEPFLGGPVGELVVREVAVHVVLQVLHPGLFSLRCCPTCCTCRAARCVHEVVVFAGAVLVVGLLSQLDRL
eukprot:8875329-Heterocapsa_arctica.AAC.1